MADTIRIGLQLVADRQWMGGVNYIVNIACATKKAMGDRVSLNIYLRHEGQLKLLDLYAECLPVIDKIILCGFKPVGHQFPRPAVHCPDVLDLYSEIDFVYPGMYNFAQNMEAGYPCAGWLTDFQHKYLPEFFTEQDLAFRDTQERKILSAGGAVFFSSQSALEDAKEFYPEYHPPMRVLHFHTAAADNWYQLDPTAVRNKHGLPDRYFICCNQFWMHKNHGVLFDALRLLNDKGENVFLACTGDFRDNRSANYFPSLQNKIRELGVEQQVKFLGVIPRAEQIALLRGSLAVLQPSRFEGWSTIVEDSRLLGKTIFLSSIPVHEEQAPEHGIYFDPLNAEDLAHKLSQALPSLQPGPDLAREEKARSEGDDLVLQFGRHFYELAREACYILPPPYGFPKDLSLPGLVTPFSANSGLDETAADTIVAATVLRNPDSLSADEAQMQKQCVDSWEKAGLTVLCCNPSRDIPTLQKAFPALQFTPEERCGFNALGLGTPRISDLLRKAGLTKCEAAGFLLPTLYIREPKRLRESILQETGKGTAVFIRNRSILTTDGNDGLSDSLQSLGVFLPREQALNLGQSEYQTGAPGWDKWLALLLLSRNIEIAYSTCLCGNMQRPISNNLTQQLREKGLLLLRKYINCSGVFAQPAIPEDLKKVLSTALPENVLSAKFFSIIWGIAKDLDTNITEEQVQQQEENYIIQCKTELLEQIKQLTEKNLEKFWQKNQPLFDQIRDYEKQYGFVEVPDESQEKVIAHLQKVQNWTGSELLHAILTLPALHLPEKLWPDAADLKKTLPFFLYYIFHAGWALDQAGDVDLIPQTLAAGYDRLEKLLQNGQRFPTAMFEACFNNENVMLGYASRLPMLPLLQSRGRLSAAFNQCEFNQGQWTPPAPVKRERIRLGVFLKVIARHTETYATIPFFDSIDRERFEIRLYVTQKTNLDIEQYAQQHADSLTVLQGNITQHLDQLRREDLDILLIGTNATAVLTDSVFFGLHRVARRQLVQFCQPYSTGLPCMDGFIAGENLHLHQKDFTEKLYLIEGSGVCFSAGLPEQNSDITITRQTCGIPENSVAFFSGANYYKIRVELLDTWTKLLAQNPTAVLVLLPFGPAWSNNYPQDKFERLLLQACKKNGIDRERVIVHKQLPTRSDVRRLIALCDVYLDSFPYSGATSLLDPFTLHMPVIAMRTPTVCGGQGAAMLEELGLNELMASDTKDYLSIAKALATEQTYRKQMGEKVKQAMQQGAPFHDLAGFGAKVQQVYLDVYQEIFDK